MANIPTPRSFNAILGDMVDAFISRFGLKSLKKGSPVLSILEAAAQSDLRSTQDTFNLLNATSLDRATGIALDRIGADEGLVRTTESPASGSVTITDTSFSKKSTRIYQGRAAPIIGSNTLYVVDATDFPAAGAIYLGRGTTNYEGPIAYSAKTNLGTYWSLTLSNNTQKFHNLGETVILAQGGNRVVNAGSLVQTPQGNASNAIQFTVLYGATIPDGETSINNVLVTAQKPGVIGNIAAGAINSFATAPFTGASVTNTLPFTNGEATEYDDAFRERIRSVRQSRALGTPLALNTAITGITANDENKRITSASIVTRQGFPTTIYIDDGAGYEERSSGTAIESLTDKAVGGEQYFQLKSKPVAKAFLRSGASAPFNMVASSQLSVAVGGVVSTHTFSESEFRSIANASAYEIVASINANSTLSFMARTSNAGTQVEILAKADANEDVQIASVTGFDANDVLLFPLGRADTLRLYKNDKLLSKDGQIASLRSNAFAQWNISTPATLVIDVDGTGAATYTFSDTDFVNAKTGFVSVGKNTVKAWVSVINNKIPGVTAKEVSGAIFLSSNAGTSSRASLKITGGTLVTGEVFNAGESSGQDNDYTLDRNLGQIRLEAPLAVGDRLSAGTSYSRAFLSAEPLTTTTSIAAGGGNLWFIVDGSAQVLSTALNSVTNLSLTVGSTEFWGNRIRLTANTAAFTNIQTGDWLILWDSAAPASTRGYYRVAAVDQSGAWIEFEKKVNSAARAEHTATLLASGATLVAGGRAGTNIPLASCEIYNLSSWSMTSPMSTPRYGHCAVRLSNGTVLVMGGVTSSGQAAASCEIYNPSTGLWTASASLPAGRSHGVAGLIASNNKVVFAGGQDSSGTAKAETYIYDVATNTWSTSDNMPVARKRATGTVLSSTKFLVLGGDNGTVTHDSGDVYTASVGWSTTEIMAVARTGHAASLLNDGKVLVTGGSTSVNLSSSLSSASLYDPNTNSFLAGASMSVGRVLHAQATLSGGNVLVVQGVGVDSSERYNHGTTSWSSISSSMPLNTARSSATLTASSAGDSALYSGGDATGDSGAYSVATSAWFDSSSAWATTSNQNTSAQFNLAANGIVFARSLEQLQKVVLAQSLYLASTFSSSIASQLTGATPIVYRTNTLRVATNTFADGGDVALVAADSEGLKTQLSTGDAIENTGAHLASVESGNSDLGTPNFQIHEVLSQESSNVLHVWGDVKSSARLVGSLEAWDGTAKRFGHQYSFQSGIKEVSARSGSTAATLRSAPSEVIPRSTMWSASPLAITPNDSLVVLVDGDTTTKRFVVPMWRKLKATGSYGTTITVKDADNSNKPLAESFGLNFDFNDFALYQAARAITHPSESAKSVLWRYTRLGPDGNMASVRYSYPTSASSALTVSTNPKSDDRTRIEIKLPSGNAKNGYTLRASSKLGLVAQTNGSLHTLTYLLGLAISSAARKTYINYTNESVGFAIGEVVTGATSNATGTISAVVDNGTTGTLTLTNVTGAFVNGENLRVVATIKAQTSGTQYQKVELTLQAPAGVTLASHGFLASQNIYVSGSGNFLSGLKTITDVDGLKLSYLEAGIDGTASNVGTVSSDVGPVTLTGATPAVVVGDILTVSPASTINSNWEQTLRISAIGAQFISGTVENFTGPVSTTPIWETLNDVSSFSIYSLTGNTASAIVSAVNAAAGSPIKGTLLGNGTGTISQSTMDESNAPNYWFDLADGINYIKTTTSPTLVTGDYQLELKEPIAAALSGAGSDWANEDIRLVPTSTATLAKWLNSPAVTGLGNVCEIKASSGGKKIQISSLTSGSSGSIQIQGGLANSASAVVVGGAELADNLYPVSTIPVADGAGLTAGMWVSLDNAIPMPKNVLGQGTVLQSIILNENESTATFTISGSDTYNDTGYSPILSKSWTVTKQGGFICFTHKMVNASDMGGIAAKEGDWVRITAATSSTIHQLNSLNLGIFRIVRVQNDSLTKAIWIENSNGVEEFGECNLYFYKFDSLMPGDMLSISTDLWGTDNKGQWTIVDVGNSFTDKTKFKVSTTSRTPTLISSPTPALQASDAKLIQVLEAAPSRLIKQISAISPSGAEYLNIKFTTDAGWGSVSETAGTVISGLDKLDFGLDTVAGIDGYSYGIGLIGEANKVLYGDPTDTASYPGVIAAGANVNISGPVVKRVQVGLSLRIRSGISTNDITSRVRSVVAATINSSAVGESIAISDVVAAASKVNGILAISVTSPSYNSSNDLIPVQPQEKALVLSLEQDILISFVSD